MYWDNKLIVRYMLLGLAFLVLFNGNAVCTKAQSQSETVLVGGIVIDGTGAAPIKDAVILIKGNRIVSVGTKGKIKYSKSARVIDTAGKYVLPGLIDIHVHYNDWMGELFLAHGVTTVKDVGNYVEWISVVSAAIEQGKVRGPRIFYVGNGLATPPPKRDHFIGLESPQMAKRVVELLHERGAVAIKVREKVTPELLRAITEEAHRLHIRVTGHIRRVNAYEAALAGIDGLEHASGIVQATADSAAKIDLDNITDDYQRYVAERKSYALINSDRAAELVKFLAGKNVALIPTMAGWWRMATERRDDFAREDAEYARNPTLAYVPEDTRKIWATSLLYKLNNADDLAQVRTGYKNVQDILRQHYKAGGKVLAGSDTFISIPGLSLQRELVFLVDAGFTPMEAISIATHENAQFLGKDKELGTLAPGKLADLLIVNANPLEDIRNTQRAVMVFKNGEMVDINYHADYSIPTPRPTLTRPLWIERQLQNQQKANGKNDF
ncbi:MAG TPA: amidohydrolase family protein [Pyrinomonadaceae bacterium]|nr:amidohydrolase family protein [Pyrinomonadaceae bacterium]